MTRKWLFAFFALSSCLNAAEQETPQVIVLGGGVGGLTAALNLGRANISHIVIEGLEPGGALALSPMVQNWPGEIEIPGMDLVDKIRSQAETNGSRFIQEEVTKVDFSKRPFTITTNKKSYQAQSCIIGLGSKPRFLGVPGEETYWTKGVYSCAVCDGALYKDRVVAVVGGGDSAITEASYLSNIAKKVHIFVRKPAFRAIEENRRNEMLAKPNVEVHYQTTIEEIKGDQEALTSLNIKDHTSGDRYDIDVDALFLAVGSLPSTDLFAGQLELSPQGYIALKNHQETSVSGVYAIGDITDGICKQAICASGDAATAVIQLQSTASPVHEIVEISSRLQFDDEIKNSTIPVIVDFYATRCGPCRQLMPFFEKWAKEQFGKYKVLKVNIDKIPELSERYKIRSIPSLLIFQNDGKLLDRKVGSRDILDYINQKDIR